jgi:integrase
MLSLDMALGLRHGELAGLKWEDVHFEKLFVNRGRSKKREPCLTTS